MPLSVGMGDVVRVCGLRNATQLNGLVGRVVSEEEEDRYGVRFLEGDRKSAKVKRENFEIVPYCHHLKKGSIVRAHGFGDDVELSHLEGRLGSIVAVEGEGKFHIQFNFPLYKTESLAMANLKPFSAEVLEHPGEPLLPQGDQGGLLELIRTTHLGEEQLCHIAGEKCYELSYKNAPENFMARLYRDDLAGNYWARKPPEEIYMEKSMMKQFGLNPANQLNKTFDEKFDEIETDLPFGKRHVFWIQMDAIGHHCVLERLAGNQGWRFYQCYAQIEHYYCDYFSGHNHGHVVPDGDDGALHKLLPGYTIEMISTRANGYSLLQWVSKDPNKMLVSPMKGIPHPHEKWGEGKVLSRAQAIEIWGLCVDLEKLAGQIVDRVLTDMGVGPVPTEPSEVEEWAARAEPVVTAAKDYHDRGCCSGNLLRDASGNVTVDLYLGTELGPKGTGGSYAIPGDLADQLDRLFVSLTGEFPSFMTYVKIIMFSMRKWTVSEDGLKMGFVFRLTESSDSNLGFNHMDPQSHDAPPPTRSQEENAIVRNALSKINN